MSTKITDLNIQSFREFLTGFRQVNIDDDFCVVEMMGSMRNPIEEVSFQFDGFLLVWCIRGSMEISINLTEYEVGDNNILLCMPGNILRLGKIPEDLPGSRYVCVAMSRNFVTGQKHDVGKIFSNILTLMDDPKICIREEETAIMAEYLEMMCRMAGTDVTYKKECVQALWMSMLYVLAGVLERRENCLDGLIVSSTSRGRQLFERFISLVAEYHDRHRNVGFYADKLCLTPKYLSKLIKNATGRSAPEWIDSYVILEAKNMLKYSNDTIKEIVYKLNFPNQSVFYKFFKARTGMTPSEYRKS